MALSFAQARTIAQGRIADSSDNDAVDQALNQAQREVARARRWPELIVRAFLTTVAAYDTGTVAVTNGSATVTLTDGVWPADIATNPAYRFALSPSDPWYTVSARDSDTQITLADNYVGATGSGKSYVVYRSHYVLPSAVDRVEEMWLHDDGRMVPLRHVTTDQQVTEFLHYPSGPGVPTAWYSMERASGGERQVLLGPATPDAIYRVEYTYKKKTTDGTLSLDESRWPVVLARACALLYEPEFPERAALAQREYKRLLRDEWASESESQTQSVRVGQSRVRYPSSGGYLDDLMGHGRVQDPS